MKEIQFLGSFPGVAKCPDPGLPEFAFTGRSNVGKSSLINYLCQRKNLAKTSGTPGKTQLINLFAVDNRWILADLPGYGYARTSKKARAQFDKMIKGYLTGRRMLCCAFQLIDVRIPPQELDIIQINWLGAHQIPFVIVFTKAEKLGQPALDRQIQTFFAALSDHWETLPPHFVTSSTGKMGGKDVLAYIDKIVNQ